MLRLNNLAEFESYLNRNIFQKPESSKSDTSQNLTKKQHSMVSMHLRDYNRKRGKNFGLRRHFYYLVKYSLSRLDKTKIMKDHAEEITSIEKVQNMSDEELFLTMDSHYIPPELEHGKKSKKICYPPFEEDDRHVLNCIKDLLGFKDVIEVYRLFIIWTFSESEYFDVYRLDGKFSKEYYLKKLKVYVKDDEV